MSLSVPEIRQKLENPYHRRDWQQLLYSLFPNGEYKAEPNTIALPQNDLAEEAFELGSITLDGGLPIGLFEIKLLDKVKLERNRVGLRQLLKQIMQQLPGALVVFYQDDKWRLTYVSQALRKDENGQLVSTQTAPKRFTYLLGKGESTLTAAQRFEHLHQRASSNLLQRPSLIDFEDAFNVEKLSKDFFRGYKEHYEKFLAHILVEPAYRTTIFKADGKAARDFTKKLLGRIVFLYFLQKKGWLAVPEGKKWGDGDHNFLQHLFSRTKNKEQFYSNILVELFYDTLNSSRPGYLAKLEITRAYGLNIQIPYLNGGLFENDDQHTDVISFPPKLFEDLFTFFGQFNFTVYEDSPDDHTVAVDPEMLGRIFESLLEEHRNKTGAFYTPKQVVHFMCRESLLQYLRTYSNLIDESKLQTLTSDHEATNITKAEAKHLDKLLQDVRICDPAIGSGAFPMGLLYEIFHARLALHPIINPEEELDAAEVKKQIIERSIYGVDIESGAVDIAQLRFWLALVVDESEPRELPNLDYKIIAGNSLVSRFQNQPIRLNWHVTLKGNGITTATQEFELLHTKLQMYMQKLYNKQQQFFNFHGDKTKQKNEVRQLKIEILRAQIKLNRFDFEQRAAENTRIFDTDQVKKLENKMRLAEFDDLLDKLNMLEKHPERNLDFFDWQIDFAYIVNPEVAGDNSGFDIVIGNPPYGAELPDYDKEVLKEKYDYLTERIRNSFLYFIGQSLDLVAKNGIVSLIIPNEFLFQIYMTKARNYVLNQTTLLHAINVGESVFDAIVPSALIALKKEQKAEYDFKIADLREADFKEVDKQLNTSDFNIVSKATILQSPNAMLSYSGDDAAIINHLNEMPVKFESYCEDIANGISTSCDEIYIVNKDLAIERSLEVDFLRPTIRGGQFNRYQCPDETGEYVVYIKKPVSEDEVPNIYKYLEENKELLIRKSVEKRSGKRNWQILFRGRYEELFATPKILIRQTGDSIIACVDVLGYYCIDSVNIALPNENGKKNLYFLLALLNSKVITFYYRAISQESGRVLAQVKPMRIRQLPIAIATDEEKKKIEQLVGYILHLKYPDNEQLIHHTTNERIAITIEEVLEMIVFELYFRDHVGKKDIDVLKFIPVDNHSKGIEKEILSFYNWLQQHENPVRNRIILADIVSKDIVVAIKQKSK